MFELLLTNKKNGGASLNGYGLFSGGAVGAVLGGVVTTEKYRYSNDVVSEGTALSLARYFHASAGNNTIGIIACGYVYNGSAKALGSTEKTQYSADVRTTGKALYVSQGLSAVSNVEVGVFSGGTDNNLYYLSTTRRYAYGTDTVLSGVAMSKRARGAATGNLTLGLFVGGTSDGATSSYLLKTDKYTYSADSYTNGSNLATKRYSCAAIGNRMLGVVIGGYDGVGNLSSTEIYQYNTDSVSAGSSLFYNRREHAAAGNNQFGIITGGSNGDYIAYTEKYELDIHAISVATFLSSPKFRHSGVSSTPGWSI